MATRSVSTRNLVGKTSLSFIRSQVISFKITGTKPNTRMYAFFDGVLVDQYINPRGAGQGAVSVTDASGALHGTFTIPGMTFNTGNRELKFLDTEAYQTTSIPGSTVGTANATFFANGLKETYQETINTTTTVTLENVVFIPAPEPEVRSGTRDPLAQSFFTYGVTGGCYITKVDIFFQSKDPSIPVTLELREMSNGYPSQKRVSTHSVVTLAPSAVNLSNTAAVATSFTFSRPIYLEENRDYCFVLLANSNLYNVWTSKLGEKSIENSRTIFQQPFIGSLFKSENNVTWTAEQTEDIKFNLFKASFATGTSALTFKAIANDILLPGTLFSVTNGSPVVTAKFDFEHTHKTGDKIYLTGNGSTYRGIPNSAISDVNGLTVTAIDEKTLTFTVGVNATSTGTLETAGRVNFVAVDSGGSGYVAPTISFSGGGGSGATATATVVGGRITAVTVTNGGSGYTSTPNLILSDSSGSGASLVPVADAVFIGAINRPYQTVIPYMVAAAPGATDITNTIKASNTDYVAGEHIDAPINKPTNMRKRGALVNNYVQSTLYGSTNSTEMITRLSSTNSNISPMVDMGETPAVRLYNFLVNGSSNGASETSHTTGTAKARYISAPVTVETVSKDVRVLVEAASINTTSFDVFVRTSVSNSSTKHTDGDWVKLNCKTQTNLSGTLDEFKDYEFVTASQLPLFDVYDIKIVLYSENKYDVPQINNYRAIVLAT